MTRSVQDVIVDDATTLEVHRVVGAMPGPTVALLGGVHGDEPEGVVAVQRILDELSDLEFMGSVVAVPVCAPAAFHAGTRHSPRDGENLARAFPGDSSGSPTSRVAFAITTKVLRGADLLVDLHSAGRDYRMPLFAGAVADGSPQARTSLLAANAFGAPLTWLHNTMNPGRSISAAWERGIPAIYAETGGGGRLRASDVDAYVTGFFGVMAHLKMILGPFRPASVTPRMLVRGGTGNVDIGVTAGSGGWCVPLVKVGQVVEKGGAIAKLLDADGRVCSWIAAPDTGLVMMLRHRAEICEGDLVVMLGPSPQPFDLVDSSWTLDG